MAVEKTQISCLISSCFRYEIVINYLLTSLGVNVRNENVFIF